VDFIAIHAVLLQQIASVHQILPPALRRIPHRLDLHRNQMLLALA
jgi:hypothetical protein